MDQSDECQLIILWALSGSFFQYVDEMPQLVCKWSDTVGNGAGADITGLQQSLIASHSLRFSWEDGQ